MYLKVTGSYLKFPILIRILEGFTGTPGSLSSVDWRGVGVILYIELFAYLMSIIFRCIPNILQSSGAYLMFYSITVLQSYSIAVSDVYLMFYILQYACHLQSANIRTPTQPTAIFPYFPLFSPIFPYFPLFSPIL